MEHKIHFSTFSNAEDSVYERLRDFRDRFWKPVCVFLTHLGVKPDHLSYLNLVMVFGFVYFLIDIPLISFFALLTSVILDSIDGSLARHQKVSSDKGSLLDIGMDHFVLMAVILTLIYTKAMDGFWGAAYAINYLVMIMHVLSMRALRLHVFPVVRSKYYLYLVWALFLFTGLNYLDVFLVFFSIYMFLTNLFLFRTFRCSLS